LQVSPIYRFLMTGPDPFGSNAPANAKQSRQENM
jgi:hypothetical protein